jgi:hypothetical protein
VDFEDYFSLTLGTPGIVTVTATFNTGNLDLDLELLTGAGVVLRASAGSTGTETVTANVSAGTHIVRAFKSHKWGGDYTLAVSVVPDTNPTPPVITAQPVGLTVAQGQSATFTVSATGSAPLHYQWRKDGGNLAGATSSSFNLPNAQPSNAGVYSVLVSNSVGSVLSSNAALIIIVPPAITSQPTGLTVAQGQSATFSVSVTGTAPLHYQWRKDGGNLAGATSSSFNLPNAQPSNAGVYSVIVSNSASTVTSFNAPLIVNRPPVPSSPQLQRFLGQGLKVPETILLGSDPDGDPIHLVAISPVSALGGLVRTNKGFVFYLPPAGQTNQDSFNYTIADSRGASATGTASIVITSNQAASLTAVLSAAGRAFRLTGGAVPGGACTFEFTGNLDSAVWQELGTVIASSQGKAEYVDRPPNEVSARYYRTVTVVGPPKQLEIISLGQGSFPVLNGQGIPGREYRIEFAAQQNPSAWQTLGMVVAGASGEFEYVAEPGSGPQTHYYRAITDVVPGPKLEIASPEGGLRLLLTGSGPPGQACTIEFTTNLTAPVWRPLGTVITDSSGKFKYADLPPAGVPSRFYRTIQKGGAAPSLAVALTGNRAYRLRFDSIPGITHRIEYTESLAPPNWQPLGSSMVNEFGVFEWTDIPPPNSPQRYYRSVHP